MSNARFLPGIDTASAHNRLLVSNDQEAQRVDFCGDRQPDDMVRSLALQSLSRKRSFAATAGALSLEHLGNDNAELASSGYRWQDLIEDTMRPIRAHIDQQDLSGYAQQGEATLIYASAGVATAAKQGVRTTAAFLEVIPKVLFKVEIEKPNSAIAEYARRSKGFMIEWLGVHDDVDYMLAYALAAKKPVIQGDIFRDLHFNPRWFHDDEGRIKIRPDKAPDLRDHTHINHPSSHQGDENVLFGCPARKMVPVIYDAMVNAAEAAGLFEATYAQERQNHGYVFRPSIFDKLTR